MSYFRNGLSGEGSAAAGGAIDALKKDAATGQVVGLDPWDVQSSPIAATSTTTTGTDILSSLKNLFGSFSVFGQGPAARPFVPGTNTGVVPPGVATATPKPKSSLLPIALAAGGVGVAIYLFTKRK